jgi:D-arabinose 1-dehydrogenase-like Zn-dependent alcohol dehydrogenase
MRLVLDAVDDEPAAMAVLPDEPTPTPERGEVVVAMEWGGLNRIDLMLLQGRVSPPAGRHVLGAQGAGRISACGEGADGLTPGQLVALYPYGGCGNCARCTAGNETLCRRARLDGVNAPGMLKARHAGRLGNVLLNLRDKPPIAGQYLPTV